MQLIISLNCVVLGEYKFGLEANFDVASKVQLFSHPKKCDDCEIAYSSYFENDQWKAFSLSINKHCVS